MDLLLILTYAAIAYAIFKIFRIPVTAYTLLTAVLGGVFLIGALLLGMNYNHPFSSEGRFYFVTTPILPGVSGRVTEVPIQPNTPVKAGDVLFRIEDDRYRNAVRSKEAALADAEQAAQQLKASADAARSTAEAAEAARSGALDLYERSQKLITSGAISQAQFKQSEERYFSAKSAADAARSEAENAMLAATAAIEGVNTDVARLQSELATARYELEQTTVRAPTDGVVIQLFLRPGMYVVPMPLRPVMVFMHAEAPTFASAFLQNSSQRLIEGSKAEVILPSVPGRFFKAHVASAGAYVPQGQLQPSGTLVDPAHLRGDGRIIVQIDFDEDISSYHIVPGSSGEVAIYTDHFHHLQVIRKVLLRMKSWLYYLFGEGH